MKKIKFLNLFAQELEQKDKSQLNNLLLKSLQLRDKRLKRINLLKEDLLEELHLRKRLNKRIELIVLDLILQERLEISQKLLLRDPLLGKRNN